MFEPFAYEDKEQQYLVMRSKSWEGWSVTIQSTGDYLLPDGTTTEWRPGWMNTNLKYVLFPTAEDAFAAIQKYKETLHA
jgi:hypothetical protein